jgi:hypothetical protein
MPSRMTISLPTHALEKLMEGYRTSDPALMALLNEFHVLAIQPHDERALAVWEDEGGMPADVTPKAIATRANRGARERLSSVIYTLQYCLETFEQVCQCGRCDPCTRGIEDIRQSIRDVENLIRLQPSDHPAHLAALPGWDAKIADLFNHGLNDEGDLRLLQCGTGVQLHSGLQCTPAEKA